MKDNFSSQSDQYAKYRPTYPLEFFEYLNSLLPTKQNVWDCGTGNGQVAYELSKMFSKVYATDISKSQIENAIKKENINYSVQPAEKTNFPDHTFDLITIAQAIHWFDFDQFYAEAKRTAKKNSFIAAIGYGRIQIAPAMDTMIDDFYQNVIGIYWDKERKYIDENYKTIPFPFEEIQTPSFAIQLLWTEEHLIGYLNTWSAVKHYITANGHNPVDELRNKMKPFWEKQKEINVQFELLLRIGKII
ncbi:class I SAM-dependent methyltransferase [Leptospira perdikensis]|uniref:Class I SAM-dependent methyltransferase n=1 Tax=Leptospira perdikensis TaxID=2484948 RepID=A0A4R9JJ89_9LEPT|nr:class I SAM-dependent methyltransferase [Leptospira perdikensis]TGL44298.1 class I SAM-dependent methyltransferase [Leptospira perdikensis]